MTNIISNMIFFLLIETVLYSVIKGSAFTAADLNHDLDGRISRKRDLSLNLNLNKQVKEASFSCKNCSAATLQLVLSGTEMAMIN